MKYDEKKLCGGRGGSSYKRPTQYYIHYAYKRTFKGETVNDFDNIPQDFIANIKLPILPKSSDQKIYRYKLMLLLLKGASFPAIADPSPAWKTSLGFGITSTIIMSVITLMILYFCTLAIKNKEFRQNNITNNEKHSFVIIMIFFIICLGMTIFQWVRFAQAKKNRNRYNEWKLLPKLKYSDCYIDFDTNSNYKDILGTGIVLIIMLVFSLLFTTSVVTYAKD